MADNPEVPAQTSESQGAFKARAKDLGGNVFLQLVGQAGPSTAGTPVDNTVPSNASVQVMAANANRAGAFFGNKATVRCYVRFGGAASSSLYSFDLTPGEVRYLGPGVPTVAVEARLDNGADAALMTQEFTW